MAKAPAKAEEGDDVPKKKGKLGLIIVIVLLVVLIPGRRRVGRAVAAQGRQGQGRPRSTPSRPPPPPRSCRPRARSI